MQSHIRDEIRSPRRPLPAIGKGSSPRRSTSPPFRSRSSRQLRLLEAEDLLPQPHGRGQGLQPGQGLRKREAVQEFHQTNQVSALPADMAIEHLFALIDMRGWLRLAVQRAQSGDFLAPVAARRLPTVLTQIPDPAGRHRFEAGIRTVDSQQVGPRRAGVAGQPDDQATLRAGFFRQPSGLRIHYPAGGCTGTTTAAR
jgi:hypothetical protein